MHIFTLALGPLQFAIDWRGPSWFCRGWRGWAFNCSAGFPRRRWRDWRLCLCGIGLYFTIG